MNRQKPFIVEFTGTPEAGKTTTIDLVEQKLLNLGYTVKVYPESAEKSKSIFPRDSYVKSKFDAKFWMHLETLKNLVEAPYQNYDIIFNTVPAIYFTKKEIDTFKNDIKYIELASFPGGIDKHYAKIKSIDIIDGSKLPSRYSKISAGYLIGETIDKMIKEGKN